MADVPVLKTDFCIGGFPKCGTTALVHFLESSPGCNVARHNGSEEAPVFSKEGQVLDADYKDGFANGHKFSAYIFMMKPLEFIYDQNPDVLFLFCIRKPIDVLISWHRMHQNMAIRGEPETHFVNEDRIARDFYRTCDLESYFDEYARIHIDQAKRLSDFQRTLPRARYLIISQERLAQDARGVMRRIHGELNVSVGNAYYGDLPEAHESFASKQTDAVIGARVRSELEAANRRMIDFLKELDPEKNLTLSRMGSTQAF